MNKSWTPNFQKTCHGLNLRNVTTFLPYSALLIDKQNNIELIKILNVPKWESQKFSILLNYGAQLPHTDIFSKIKKISRAKLLTLKHIFKILLYILIGAHLALMFQIIVIGSQIVFWFLVSFLAITWALDI
jgi:hypothetical protein